MKAIGYVRVSTDRQASEGVSLEAQAEKIRQMAQLRDFELIDIVVDAGESAKDTNRPGLQRVLAMVDARLIDAVVILKLDRLTRSVRDLGNMMDRFGRRGVALISVNESLDTQSPAGRLVLNIMTSVAQWEREAIGERTTTALAHKRAKGEKLGGACPYGFDAVERGGRKHLVPNEGERRVLETMRQMKAAGRSYQQIADALNASELFTKEGKPWVRQYCHRVLAGAKEPACPTA
jgi:site-specific DNA recombinase